MSHTFTGLNLIDGQWVGSSDIMTRATSPVTGQSMDPAFRSATTEEIDRAFAAASAAFAATRDLPATRWADLLEKIAERIEALGEVLLTTAQAETALPQPRLIAERGRTIGQLRLFAQLVREGSWVDAVIDTADPNRKPLPKPDVRRMRRALGPIVVFDASNFPFAFGPCGGDTAAALAAGNPVLVKAHSGHPATDELFGVAVLEALKALELPAGLFAVLHGSGQVVGAKLVNHSAARAVGFTGSRAGGMALQEIANSRLTPIPIYAEMGSLNPLVILPRAMEQRRDAIAEGLAGSVTLGAGQFCTKPGVIFVLDGAGTDAFIETFKTKLAATGAFTMLNPGMQKAFGKSLDRFRTVSYGVKSHVRSTCSGAAGCTAHLIEVTSDAWRQEDLLHEEAFGPAALIIRCRDQADLLSAIAAADGNLTGSIHVGSDEDPALVRAVQRQLESQVGRLLFNGYPTGVEVCHAMVHGGPYPATTAPGTTSVGTMAIVRFVRPVAFQNLPEALLPAELQNANPRGIWRLVNGQLTRDAL